MTTTPKKRLTLDEHHQKRRREDDMTHWRFDKRLSVNTLVSVIGMALVVGGPVLVWGRAMESRVQALEIESTEKAKLEVTRDSDSRESRTALTVRLDKMDDKLSQMQVQVAQLVVQLNLKANSLQR